MMMMAVMMMMMIIMMMIMIVMMMTVKRLMIFPAQNCNTCRSDIHVATDYNTGDVYTFANIAQATMKTLGVFTLLCITTTNHKP